MLNSLSGGANLAARNVRTARIQISSGCLRPVCRRGFAAGWSVCACNL